MIQSLTSGIVKRQINSTKQDKEQTQIKWYGETEIELGKISSTYNPNKFCNWFISAVNITTVYHDDIDQWNDEQKVSSIISNKCKWQYTQWLDMWGWTIWICTDNAWYANTLLSKVKSKLGTNTCANVYTQEKFTQVVPMTSRKDAGKSQIEFTNAVKSPSGSLQMEQQSSQDDIPNL
jgi:hypothetical protein